jgi:P4 family phage/plasmid primase-like protien
MDSEKVFGGSYNIQGEDLDIFYKLYYKHVFINKNSEHITEKQHMQPEGCGPLVIDLDMQYDYTIAERQHTIDHILDFMAVCLNELTECFSFEEGTPIPVYVFEKKNVNRLKEQNITKDGIHFTFGVQVDRVMQLLLRDLVLKNIEDNFDALPLKQGHNWDKVYDQGVSAGCVNWQLYGSRKPNNEAYEIKSKYNCSFDSSDGGFKITEKEIDLENDFIKMTATYTGNIELPINPKIIHMYESKKEVAKKKSVRSKTRAKTTLLSDEESEADDDIEEGFGRQLKYIKMVEIINREMLEKAMKHNVTSRLKDGEYDIQEAHEYTQILPEKFYEPGSHVLNRQVAFALKHTSPKLFLSWIMLRSKASDFDYGTIPGLYSDWKQYFNRSCEKGVTKNSIIFWASQNVPEEYEKVKLRTINQYIDISLGEGQTEFDIANVMFQMEKDKYVCISLSNRGIWNKFEDNRWVPDKGMSLRKAASTTVYALYKGKQKEMKAKLKIMESVGEDLTFLKQQITAVAIVLQKLKKTSDKNNIIREAMELFYDDDFIEKTDTNLMLMGFKNGVVDFEKKEFRTGLPQDYITKTTKIDYIPSNTFTPSQIEIKNSVVDFMQKLFPVPNVNAYMWEHLASVLIGTTHNQTFNVYFGSGSNGKSLLVDLMSKVLGQYKAVVPLSLVTEKRAQIGGTSSEIIQLKGIRYGVMQESSKGTKINEGPMKEVTGGDDLTGRALFNESETFTPQFTLVMCTNSMFEVETTDDGTWRRIRKCDFVAKFVDKDDKKTYNSKYIFPKDKTLSNKLEEMAPIFMSLLVDIAFERQGIVNDCTEIMDATNKYRKSQDSVAAFISECIETSTAVKAKIGKSGVREAFKIWHSNECGSKKAPNTSEIFEALNDRFGDWSKKVGGWAGLAFVEEDDDEDVDLNELQTHS